jgi:hypothetical protein
MTIHFVPSNDVSVAKKVLIPATVAAAIGIAGLGGHKQTGERICTQAEMCQPEKIRPDLKPSIALGQATPPITTSGK